MYFKLEYFKIMKIMYNKKNKNLHFYNRKNSEYNF